MAEERDHISISPVVFYLLIGAAGVGGLGGGTFLGPRLDEATVSSCLDGSEEAIRIAVDAAERATFLREYIEQRTADRYTGAEARKNWQEQDKRDAQQDRRIEAIERRMHED